MRPRTLTVALLALLTTLVASPGVAWGQVDPLVPTSVSPASLDKPPPGFRLTAREAIRIAERLPEVRRERRDHPELRKLVEIPLSIGDARRFEVVYSVGTDIRADIHVSGLTGEVLEVWTGPQAEWLLARGYEPSIGASLNRPYVWLPLAALFLLPFFDPRRPFRLLHLDLAVLLGFGVSQLYHNKGEIELSIPIVYPLLAYLLARTLLAAFRPRERRGPLVPYARTSWLAVALVLLVAFRIGLNLADSEVVDVGYASVIGADRIAHKKELYIFNEVHGDTYGPVTYLAYMPFELLFPSDGTWGSVPAAHAAAIVFDLLAIVGLMLLGAQLRPGSEGRRLGLALGFAWAAYPFTLLVLQANTNDGLVAALVVFALVALRSPPARGLMLGLATAAKFAPVVIAPLLAAGTGGERRTRSWLWFAALFGVAIALPVLLYLPDGGLREFYDATIGFQLGRDSPFSLWGLHPSLSWLQDLLKLAALALATAAAFVPRRRDLRQVAGLAAAVLISAQLVASHWFYFYLVWIAPLVLVVALGGYRSPERWTDELGMRRPLAKATTASGRSPH